jgi:hypothetical protein
MDRDSWIDGRREGRRGRERQRQRQRERHRKTQGGKEKETEIIEKKTV